MEISKESKIRTVKRLLKEHRELYVVDVYIETDKAGTHQWYVYPDRKSASHFMALDKRYHKNTYKSSYKKLADRNGYEYKTIFGDRIKTWFECKRAT